jgi:hypothetical protein
MTSSSFILMVLPALLAAFMPASRFCCQAWLATWWPSAKTIPRVMEGKCGLEFLCRQALDQQRKDNANRSRLVRAQISGC